MSFSNVLLMLDLFIRRHLSFWVWVCFIYQGLAGASSVEISLRFFIIMA